LKTSKKELIEFIQTFKISFLKFDNERLKKEFQKLKDDDTIYFQKSVEHNNCLWYNEGTDYETEVFHVIPQKAVIKIPYG